MRLMGFYLLPGGNSWGGGRFGGRRLEQSKHFETVSWQVLLAAKIGQLKIYIFKCSTFVGSVFASVNVSKLFSWFHS